MKNWYMNLEVREKQVVLIGAAALLLLLVYLAIWEPLIGGYRNLQNSVKAQRDTVQWMLKSSAEARVLGGSKSEASKGLDGRSLLAVVDNTARGAGLGPALKRVEPEGSDVVKVWLEDAMFDSMMKWIGGLGSVQGVQVRAINLERKDIDGRVNSRVTLVEPPHKR